MLTYIGSVQNDPAILEWIADHNDQLGEIATGWFRTIRSSGADVSELLHDGYPTACVGDFPFAYVGAFKKHVNVGFFYGAELPDPTNMLEGTGKRMRHVKVRIDKDIDTNALEALIRASYLDIKQRINTDD